MVTFLQHLTKQLDKEAAGWQENTTFLLDNATWHNSEEIKEQFAKMRLNITYSAPYCYSSAPVEMVFAALKFGDLNPDRLPTGKK